MNKRLAGYKHAQQQAVSLAMSRRKEEERRIVRFYIPKVEFELIAIFHGRQEGAFLLELRLAAHNRGNARRKFKRISIRIRGIGRGAKPQFLDRRGRKRLEFPYDLVKDDLVPQGEHFFFVEPGIGKPSVTSPSFPNTSATSGCTWRPGPSTTP